MTIINHSYKFIFVHVPKSAGTSLTTFFSKYSKYHDQEIGGTAYGQAIAPHFRKRFGIGKHSTASKVRTIVGAEVWSEYYTFGFVRNPFERLFSVYKFLRKWEGEKNNLNTQMRGFSSFEEFIRSKILDDTDGPDNIFKPQIHWLQSAQDPNLRLVNFVGKVEQINENVSSIQQILNLPKFDGLNSVPSLNKTQENSQAVRISQSSVEYILQRYEADFSMYGYSVEPTGLFVIR